MDTAQAGTPSVFCLVLWMSVVKTLELRASELDADSDIDCHVTKQDAWSLAVGIAWCPLNCVQIAEF